MDIKNILISKLSDNKLISYFEKKGYSKDEAIHYISQRTRLFLDDKYEIKPFVKAVDVSQENYGTPEEKDIYEADLNDLILLIDNERDLYDRLVYIYKNLSRKKQKNIFDPIKAEKIFIPLINDAAKRWHKSMVEWADDDKSIVMDVSPAVKHETAKEMVNRFEKAYELQEYDFMKTSSKDNLKDEIKKAFPKLTEEDFSSHETDLYVRYSPELFEWLKENYDFFENIEKFKSQIDGDQWLDIPFAAWEEKYKTSSKWIKANEWNEEFIVNELSKEFDENKEEIEKTLDMNGGYSDFGNSASVVIGGEEYIVVEDIDEAERIATQIVKQDLEDQPELFNQEWLISRIDEEEAKDFFEQVYSELNDGYAREIMMEDDDEYTNRLAGEMYERDIISEEEALDPDFNLEDKIDEFVEDMTQEQIDEGSGGYDYYALNFGEEEAMKLAIENNLINISEAAEDAISVDGWPHFISRYDGDYHETDGGLVYFRD